jgi:molybdopterin-biosynthesis enzyme MoeA-like protein
MWQEQVAPRLQQILPKTDHHWVRWTCLGLPESEVAELVENAIADSGLEVGYRAAVPYVKVKLYVDRKDPQHAKLAAAVDGALAAHTVARGFDDLANELLERWPLPELVVWDFVTDNQIAHRLFTAQREQVIKQAKFPHINVHAVQTTEAVPSEGRGLQIRRQDNEFIVTMSTGHATLNEHMTLPYKVPLNSERGKRSAAEWVLWFAVKALRAL